ncbi:hypothetical protein [Nakamurella lactea]|uniref:hypothetical protein n=1 Tax=Nakamurella lactea TaxID=459515 RepID=UPI000419A8E2|nr:hypothetical protein [Nakamurella lactea]
MTQRRLTATLLATLLICLLAGGVGAYFLGQHRAAVEAAAATPPTDEPNSSPAVVTTAGDTAGDDTASTGDTAAADGGTVPDQGTEDAGSTVGNEPEPDSSVAEPAPPTASVGPELTTAPGRDLTDDTEVRLSAAAGKDPQASEIRDLLQRHFDAINAGDYQLWAGTVTKDQAKAISSDRWRNEYSTTTDTGMSITAIETEPRQAQLTFRSRQAPEFAPDQESTCIDWTVTLPLTTVDDTLLIGRSNENLARHSPCEA